MSQNSKYLLLRRQSTLDYRNTGLSGMRQQVAHKTFDVRQNSRSTAAELVV